MRTKKYKIILAVFLLMHGVAQAKNNIPETVFTATVKGAVKTHVLVTPLPHTEMGRTRKNSANLSQRSQ